MCFICQQVLQAVAVGVVTCLVVGAAKAQPKWQAFPAEQSRLVLDAAPLSQRPTRASELTGTSGRIRTFLYAWGDSAGRAAYADVIIHQTPDGSPYSGPPDYVALIPTSWPALRNGGGVFGKEEKSASAALGELRYRELTIGPRHCLGFGGAFGAVLDNRAQIAGYKPTGGNWIYGIYCPATGQRLTPDGARYVVEGLGWTDTKVAAAGRAKPAVITKPE